ncbi:C-C motif chemokine 20-like [Polypterus senegalus]|uniref:C-C motif chemokine 20-like n=1 Tax=Polypterus senegalus TaxID=55291 RepID=UPI001966C85F|nr:C-C motif chemokine 20-like [Polypterus senegalus]
MAQMHLAVVALTLVLTLTTLCESHSFEECCISYSSKHLPCKLIKTYAIQLSIDACHIDAIIFHTVRGRKICANPNEIWVKERMLCVDNRK